MLSSRGVSVHGRFSDLVEEFSRVAVDFAREPLSPAEYGSFYWREVIVKGFSEDFEELGYRLNYAFNRDGTLLHWHTSPLPMKGLMRFATR